jgi:hypothetical protein
MTHGGLAHENFLLFTSEACPSPSFLLHEHVSKLDKSKWEKGEGGDAGDGGGDGAGVVRVVARHRRAERQISTDAPLSS